MKSKKRTYNTQRIKGNCSYAIEEISDLYGIHKNCVRNWIKKGLPTIDKLKPYMIHGSALKAFLKDQQGSRKHTCQPNEFFCFKCKCPRKPLDKLIEIKTIDKKRVKIIGFCEACETIVSKMGAADKIAEYKKWFNV